MTLLLGAAVAGCGGSSPREAGPGDLTPTSTPTPTPTLAAHPVPSGDEIVAMAGAEVHQDFFATNDTGDVLSSVIVFQNSSTEWCQTSSPAALVWNGHDGSRRVWAGDVMARMIAPADGGFVVGAVRSDCAGSASGPHGDTGPYLITGSGDTVDIRWPAGAAGTRARSICAPDPTDERCAFSATEGTGQLRESGTPPTGTKYRGRQEGVLLATSVRDHTLSWSTDEGATWQAHRTGLASLRGVSPVVNDRVLSLSDGITVDYSLDRGRTWTVRRLPGAFDDFAITDSGIVVGVVPPIGRDDWAGYRGVVSTDATWSTVEEMPARATLGPLWVTMHGDAVYVYNRPDKWWVSTDSGVHWRVVVPLPVS